MCITYKILLSDVNILFLIRYSSVANNVIFIFLQATGTGDVMGQSGSGGNTTSGRSDTSRPENALDALLDELQTFAKPPVLTSSSTLRRLHSYPSGEGGKPPVPERAADLLNKRVPPPPPPRTSSRSPLSSPTGPSVPPRGSPLKRNTPGRSSLKENTKDNPTLASNSSSCESVNSQEGMQHQHQQSRQELLEQRHQELLRKQRALQEQYTRLQQLQRAPPPDLLQLKKTGSESNLLAKMGLGLSAAVPISGSLSHLGPPATQNPINSTISCNNSTISTTNSTTTTSSNTAITTTPTVTVANTTITTTTNIATITNTAATTTITPPATTNKIYETDIL